MTNESKEYPIFSRTPQLHWFRICYARNEDNASSNLFKVENRKWNHRERCRCWSTIYETEATLEIEAKLIESAFHLSLIKIASQFPNWFLGYGYLKLFKIWTQLSIDFGESKMKSSCIRLPKISKLIMIFHLFSWMSTNI